MARNRNSSPIIVFSDDDDMESSTESESSWGWLQNQLGLELGEQFGSQQDDEGVALDKKGEMNHHEGIANTKTLPRQRELCDPSQSWRRMGRQRGSPGQKR
jgi:hypothetical protein